MKSISGKAFAKILERHGWNLVRIQGSLKTNLGCNKVHIMFVQSVIFKSKFINGGVVRKKRTLRKAIAASDKLFSI